MLLLLESASVTAPMSVFKITAFKLLYSFYALLCAGAAWRCVRFTSHSTWYIDWQKSDDLDVLGFGMGNSPSICCSRHWRSRRIHRPNLWPNLWPHFYTCGQWAGESVRFRPSSSRRDTLVTIYQFHRWAKWFRYHHQAHEFHRNVLLNTGYDPSSFDRTRQSSCRSRRTTNTTAGSFRYATRTSRQRLVPRLITL